MTTERALAEKHTYRYWPTVVFGTLIPGVWIWILVLIPGSSVPGLVLRALGVAGSVTLSIRCARSRAVTTPDGVTLFNFFRTWHFEWSRVAAFEVRKWRFISSDVVVRLVDSEEHAISTMTPFSFPYLPQFAARFQRFVDALERDRERWGQVGGS